MFTLYSAKKIRKAESDIPTFYCIKCNLKKGKDMCKKMPEKCSYGCT